MASLQSCAWVALFIYMWYQHTQEALPSIEKLEQSCSLPDGTCVDKAANAKDSCCRDAAICASTMFSRGSCRGLDGQKDIGATLFMSETYQSSTTNYLRLFTVMLVCSMVVVPGFQLLAVWVGGMDEKGGKREEEEDSSDEFLDEVLEEFLDDDED